MQTIPRKVNKPKLSRKFLLKFRSNRISIITSSRPKVLTPDFILIWWYSHYQGLESNHSSPLGPEYSSLVTVVGEFVEWLYTK